ncbi:MAG TPA: hypothetical protein ENN65_04410 [Candidatus Hydrogenedentes bacterium]|mgnify:FL=1|nr:hypothetical protein [Candidatus Hydrogenedentota bacterium]
MTKIYEALDNASKERAETAPRRVSAPSGPQLPKGLADTLVSLCQRIDALLEDKRCRVVEFVGAQSGNDNSRLVREFARMAATRLNKRVLLLSAGPSAYVNQMAVGGAVRGWEEMAETGELSESLFYSAGDARLTVSQMASNNISLPSVLSSPHLSAVFNGLRERFDLILIDAPSFEASSDAVLLAPFADGVIVVVEAGRTRWQAIERWVNQIVGQHGNVLGVVFNKRRDYIPRFIYRRL